MDFELKKIDAHHAEPLYKILANCGKEMHEKLGLPHWYPFMDFQIFQTSLNEKILYGIYKNKTPIATFNISTKPRDYYYDELWSEPNAPALYLGQLGIKPALQKNGIGKWCMDHVEKIAREMQCKAIRFDALGMHPWLKTFYEKLGYTSCGIVKPNKWDLVCFEKILD